ncbi:MAG TPA: DNA polymerase I, partial [Chromatiales bacterium]|nr:DNA polymerase I [Chromatiales bacterium]
RKLKRDLHPKRMAVVFDAPGKTFRDELYEKYKANRPPMPDDLREQIQPLLDAIDASGLPLLRVPGVEADDVIGTLARAAARQGMDVVIVTGDKDMAQLVDEHISLLDTMPRGPSRSPRPTDRNGVVERFGVRPDQIIDYLALVGDSSDNIPGVPKVGAKTAAALLQHYDHVDDILADLDGVAALPIRGAKSLARRLDEHRDLLELSHELARIRSDLELDIGPDDLQPAAADLDKLRSLYRQLELRRLLEDLPEDENDPDGHEAGKIGPATQYEVVQSDAQLDAWLARLDTDEAVAFDTETDSLDYMNANLVGLSFAVSPGEAAYVPVAHRGPDAPDQLDRDQVLDKLRQWLEDPKRAKIGHHLKFDAHVLHNHGIELAGMDWDTMLESYVLDSSAVRHDMDSVAAKYLGISTIHYEDVAGKGAKQITFDQVPLDQAAPYAAEDADVCLQLHRTLWPKLQSTGRLAEVYQRIEKPLVPVLQAMEETGVGIDTDLLAELSGELAADMARLETAAHAEAGHPFNLGSPKQLQEILYEELGLPVLRKTPKGQPSTAEDVLEELAEQHALPRLILEYRSVSKLKSTYTDKLPEQVNPKTGRIHTSYHQAVTSTGRLSSSDPNLQNIPIRTHAGRRIRQAFIARRGYRLLAADYSQIELRIMAELSGDSGLLKAFAEDRDIHQATAAEVFGIAPEDVTPEQRRSAKAINFGLIYGMSAFGLARQLGIPRSEAQKYVDLYFERYPGVKAYMDATRESARENGYVETIAGRRLYLPDINARQAQRRQYAERSAINAPMQGTAADIIKLAMIAVHNWLQTSGIDAQLIMQVHDELVLEVHHKALDKVRDRVVALMSSAMKLKVPLKVSAGSGRNWDEAH